MYFAAVTQTNSQYIYIYRDVKHCAHAAAKLSIEHSSNPSIVSKWPTTTVWPPKGTCTSGRRDVYLRAQPNCNATTSSKNTQKQTALPHNQCSLLHGCAFLLKIKPNPCSDCAALRSNMRQNMQSPTKAVPSVLLTPNLPHSNQRAGTLKHFSTSHSIKLETRVLDPLKRGWGSSCCSKPNGANQLEET